MAEVVSLGQGKIDLGRVVRDALAVTGKRPGFVLGLSALLAGAPSFFGAMFVGHRMHSPIDFFFSGAGVLNMVVGLLASAFLAACLYGLSLAELEGRSPTPQEVSQRAGQMFLPLLGVQILFLLGVIGGMILLIVPGVILAIRWCVSGPVLMDERIGITESLRRSAELTRGNRWMLFAIFLLFFILQAFVDSVMGAVGLGVSWGAMDVFSFPRLLGSAILSTAATALAYPGIAAIYVQLRELKGA